MSIEKLEFAKLEKGISKTGKSVSDYLAPDVGKVYVVAITRERCPACQKQKPKLDRLAMTLKKKHRDIVFTRIHVKWLPDSQEESLRCKDLFHHYFYPTNLILLRTKNRGSIEYYRNVSPNMTELRRNIEITVETAKMIKKETS